MKTRIIHTRIWEDDWFLSLSDNGQKLFIYLITNQRINLSGIYRLPDRVINFDTRLKGERLEKAKNELVGKVMFFDGWVYVKNAQILGGYKGEKNEVAIKQEMTEIPENVKNCLFKGICNRVSKKDDRVSEVSDTSINHKSEIINHKSEEGSLKFLQNLPEEVIAEFTRRFDCSPKQLKGKAEDLYNYCLAKGKTYKNYKAFLLNAVKKDFSERPPEDEEKIARIKATQERFQGSSEYAKGLSDKFKMKK